MKITTDKSPYIFRFLLFIFVVPAIQIVLICLAIGPDPKKLGFGVINEEMIANGFPTDAPCVPNPGCGVALSCRYLSMLPNESLHLVRAIQENYSFNI